ncbi:helix-turn-helix domain-containing protein [Phenylobacterium sp.]|uniref:helix-turn-helix domain-containing protein n=1 Tax=Phenylobacterium sp. TaxID=1871053 RepID=UPI003941C8BA
MNTIEADPTERLAERIRLEREARGWSQGELAQRSDVSKAMISKIERGEASPTAALLAKLSGAFELTLAALLTRAEGEGGRKVAAADQPRWRDPGTGYLRRQVFARGDHPVELVQVELPAGAKVELPASSYAFIRQVVWLIGGALTIREGARETTLSPGDSYAFGPPADSAFVNPGTEPAVYLVAVARR